MLEGVGGGFCHATKKKFHRWQNKGLGLISLPPGQFQVIQHSMRLGNLENYLENQGYSLFFLQNSARSHFQKLDRGQVSM